MIGGDRGRVPGADVRAASTACEERKRRKRERDRGTRTFDGSVYPRDARHARQRVRQRERRGAPSFSSSPRLGPWEIRRGREKRSRVLSARRERSRPPMTRRSPLAAGPERGREGDFGVSLPRDGQRVHAVAEENVPPSFGRGA